MLSCTVQLSNRNRNTLEMEALNMFLDKFVQRIILEFMSQRDFLICVANDAFWAQVDVFGDWTIKIMARNVVDNIICGSYSPTRVLQFYFNAQHRGNSPTQFKEEIAIIDFPEEVTKYTAVIIKYIALLVTRAVVPTCVAGGSHLGFRTVNFNKLHLLYL